MDGGRHSLRLRVFSFVLALAAAVAALVGAATYASVRAETDALFDYQLRQMALSLRDQGRIDEGERSVLADPALDYVVQIWTLDGVEVYSSQPAPIAQPLPARAVLGFSEVEVGGAPWRMFSAATPQRVVQVAQPLAVRRRLAADAAWRSVLPIALAAPLVALALWWLVGLSLAPLQRVAAAASSRETGGDAAALAPLPTGGLPSEVLPLVDAFNGLLARLASAFDAQRGFVADAAHELRTPLTALKLQIGLVRDARDAAEREQALERLRAGVDRAVRLAGQLLALARAEPGVETAREPIDLVALARQAIADAAPLAERRGARIELDAGAGLVLRGDPQALRSLLGNLIDNAIKYGGDAPRVRVALVAAGSDVVLCVDDSGPGIPAAERERVFDRFVRRAGGGAEGSGLGLAIVRAVAARHGGRVTLGESPAGGLRVEVRLPSSGS